MERYDPDSGQIYRETLFKKWPGHQTRDPRLPIPHLSAKGADSMMNMIRRKLAQHARSLEPEALAPLPNRIAEDLRKSIRREGRESLKVWQAFANAGHGDRSTVYSVDATSGKMYRPCVEFLMSLTSPGFAWLVDLEIGSPNCSSTDFKSLAVLCNLQNLIVRGRRFSMPFNNDYIAGLASRAAIDGSLSRLQAIYIENGPGISLKVFSSLQKFSVLDTFCVYRTAIVGNLQLRHADLKEWSESKNSELLTYAEHKLAVSYYGSVLREAPPFLELAKVHIRKRRSRDSSNSPVLSSSFLDRKTSHVTADRSADLNLLFHFERDLTRKDPRNTLVAEPSSTYPTSKRRKLNGKKRMNFEQIFDSA